MIGLFWQKWRSWIIAALSLSGLCFMLGFSYRYHLPRIKSWLLVEIENQSQKYSPLRIWPEEIDLQLVPPAIVLRGVRIIPKPNLTGNLSPAYVKEVKITLNWLSIFRGQFRLAEVHINEPSLKVRWPHLPSSGPTAPQPDPSFQSLNVKLQNLYDLPIDRLTITDLQLDLQTEDEGIQLLLNGASLTLANMFDALLLDLDFRSVQIKRANLTPLEFNLESRFLLDDENLQISALKIRKNLPIWWLQDI